MKIQKILVPTDFSQNSLPALAQAKEFAKCFEAEIVLIHVLESPVYPAMTLGAGAASLPTIQEEIRQNVSTHLENLRKEEFPDGIKARTILREGNPYGEIIAAAKEEGADLIVIATHGHTGIKHLMLGSTTEKVVRTAPCAVLTIRGPDHAPEKS
jgi:nucleotide-binding universal stress UspA family protein